MSGMPAAAPAAASVEPIAGTDADAAASGRRGIRRRRGHRRRRRAAGVPERPDRRHPRAARPEGRRPRIELVGRLGRAHRIGPPAARERPAPRPRDAVDLDADGAALRRAARRLRVRRQRLHASRGFRASIIGHNERIAWGLTNLGPDVADLYLERLDGDTYELDGAAVPLTLREETIEVAGGDPVTITVRSTGRGPLVTDIGADFAAVAEDYPAASGQPEGDYGVSLQWTALTPGTTPQAIFAMNRAQDWNAFRAAASLFDVPAQNLIYADVDGNIGYQAPGTVPVRATGDGTVPLPGWISQNGWTRHGAVRRAPVDAQPRARVHRHGQQPRERQRPDAHPGLGSRLSGALHRAAPRRAHRLGREAHGRRPHRDPARHRGRQREHPAARDRGTRPRRRRRPRGRPARRLGRSRRRRQRRGRVLRRVLAQPARRHVRRRSPTRPVPWAATGGSASSPRSSTSPMPAGGRTRTRGSPDATP